SIWRLVTQPGSSALSPYSPNDSVEPRCALPRMFPRWALRYLTRLGISMGRLLGLGGRGGSQDLALEDPDLDADRPRRRVRGGETVIDVGADRVQRHAPVAVPLAARDLAAAQPARARDADAVGAQPERGRHRLLHRPPEGHALLQLQRDVLGHELRVQLGVDDLLDVEVDLLPRARLELVLQLLHLGALAADDDAGPRGEDGDPRAVRRALDVDLRAAGTRRARSASSLTPMVRWLVRCLMKKARPIARGCTRFIEGPPSAMACTTRRSSRLRTWWLCSAFATAERSTFSTRRAAARGVYSSVARASPTDLPRIWSRTSRAFRAETRTNRARATVFMGSGLPRRRGGGLLGLAVRLERARERELAEPVA